MYAVDFTSVGYRVCDCIMVKTMMLKQNEVAQTCRREVYHTGLQFGNTSPLLSNVDLHDLHLGWYRLSSSDFTH